MTPQQKASELIDKYLNTSFNCNDCTIPFCDIACTKLYIKEAAECALIAVYEIISSSPSLPILSESGNLYSDIQESKAYWEQVKNELLKQQNNG